METSLPAAPPVGAGPAPTALPVYPGNFRQNDFAIYPGCDVPPVAPPTNPTNVWYVDPVGGQTLNDGATGHAGSPFNDAAALGSGRPGYGGSGVITSVTGVTPTIAFLNGSGFTSTPGATPIAWVNVGGTWMKQTITALGNTSAQITLNPPGITPTVATSQMTYELFPRLIKPGDVVYVKPGAGGAVVGSPQSQQQVQHEHRGGGRDARVDLGLAGPGRSGGPGILRHPGGVKLGLHLRSQRRGQRPAKLHLFVGRSQHGQCFRVRFRARLRPRLQKYERDELGRSFERPEGAFDLSQFRRAFQRHDPDREPLHRPSDQRHRDFRRQRLGALKSTVPRQRHPRLQRQPGVPLFWSPGYYYQQAFTNSGGSQFPLSPPNNTGIPNGTKVIDLNGIANPNIKGNVASSSALPATATVNDAWFAVDTQHLWYGTTGPVWTDEGPAYLTIAGCDPVADAATGCPSALTNNGTNLAGCDPLIIGNPAPGGCTTTPWPVWNGTTRAMSGDVLDFTPFMTVVLDGWWSHLDWDYTLNGFNFAGQYLASPNDIEGTQCISAQDNMIRYVWSGISNALLINSVNSGNFIKYRAGDAVKVYSSHRIIIDDNVMTDVTFIKEHQDMVQYAMANGPTDAQFYGNVAVDNEGYTNVDPNNQIHPGDARLWRDGSGL